MLPPFGWPEYAYPADSAVVAGPSKGEGVREELEASLGDGLRLPSLPAAPSVVVARGWPSLAAELRRAALGFVLGGN